MHVEIHLNGEDPNDGHMYEYNVYQPYTPEIMPPISIGHHIFLNSFDGYEDEKERSKKYRGEYVVTKVQHFFAKHQYIVAVFVDKI